MPIRRFIVTSLLLACTGVMVLSGWLFWPEWQKYRAVKSLIRSVNETEGTDYVAVAGGGFYELGFDDIDKLLSDVRNRGAFDNAMPQLLELAADDHPRVRWRAVYTIGQIAKETDIVRPQATRVLKNALIDRDDQVQVQARTALRELGAETNDDDNRSI